jgi:hypothetical protein
VSRWGYAALSASHILALAMLVGATLPLNLRLLGLWPRIEVATLARVLVPVAATGLALAILTGLALFSVRAGEYAALSVLHVKVALVTIGGAAAIWAHVRYGWTLAAAPLPACGPVTCLLDRRPRLRAPDRVHGVTCGSFAQGTVFRWPGFRRPGFRRDGTRHRSGPWSAHRAGRPRRP